MGAIQTENAREKQRKHKWEENLGFSALELGQKALILARDRVLAGTASAAGSAAASSSAGSAAASSSSLLVLLLRAAARGCANAFAPPHTSCSPKA